MTLELLTWILGGLTVGSALMVVLSNHPIRSVLFLVLTFFLISGHYILLNAQFLAVVNIIVYAGAIMVLFVFVLMLLNMNNESAVKNSTYLTLSSAIVGGLFFVLLIAALKDSLNFEPIKHGHNDVGLVLTLGKTLFSKYCLLTIGIIRLSLSINWFAWQNDL